MTHRHPTTLLEAYIDGDLSPAENASIQETITTCPECRRVYEELRQLKGVLTSHQTPDPGEQYWQEVETLIHAKTIDRTPVEPSQTSSEGKRMFIRSVVSFAVALSLFITAIALNQNPQQGLTKTTQSGAPVFAVAPLRDVLPSVPDSVFTAEDERYWAEAILMLSIPGAPGRMAGLRNFPDRPI